MVEMRSHLQPFTKDKFKPVQHPVGVGLATNVPIKISTDQQNLPLQGHLRREALG